MAIQTYSALDFIKAALRLIRHIDPIEDPEPEDADTCFQALNMWIDLLGTQRATIFKVARQVYPLSSGVSSYTIGDGATFNQVRPVWIDAVSVVPNRAAPAYELPLGPPLNIEQYQRIPLKTQQAPYPDKIFYNRNFVAATGQGSVVVHPVPNTSVCDLVLYTPEAMVAFADMATKYGFVPGMAVAIKYNLASEVQDEFNKTLSDRAERKAVSTLTWVKRTSYRWTIANMPAGIGGVAGRYDIYNDR